MENGEKEHDRRRHQRGPVFTEEERRDRGERQEGGAVAAVVTVIDS